jgi:hypothetical protein
MHAFRSARVPRGETDERTHQQSHESPICHMGLQNMKPDALTPPVGTVPALPLLSSSAALDPVALHRAFSL